MNTAIFWVALGIIVLAYMTLWYALALYTKRFDVVDSAWGIGFVVIAWVSLALRAQFGAVQLVSASLVSIWGLRLFAHIANRNWRKHEDDHRYQVLLAGWGDAARRKAFTNIFLLQGALLIAVSLPMIAIAFAGGIRPNPGVYVGWVLWLTGIATEALADYQLTHFIAGREKGSHAIMDRGLWRYSRHPNYFGEVTTWWGAAIVAVSVGGWWGIAGAVIITILITKVSGIPPLEKHYDGNKLYEAYRQRTSVFVPLPPKKPEVS